MGQVLPPIASLLLVLATASTSFPGPRCPQSTGSDNDRPTADTARLALQANITGPLAGRLQVGEFRKTDGLSREVQGMKMYALEFAATATFLDDMLYELSESGIKTSPPARTLNDGGAFSWDAWSNTAVAGRRPARSGDKLTLVGKVEYVQYESGWRVAAITFRGTLDTGGRAPDSGRVAESAIVGSGGTATAPTSGEPTLEPSWAPGFPIASGRGTTTDIVVDSEAFAPIQLLIDGASESVTVRAWRSHHYQLEVGSTHMIRAVVKGKVYQVRYTATPGGKLTVKSGGIIVNR